MTDSMKIYYDADGTPTWTQITGIVQYPITNNRVNEISQCTVIVRDYEGAKYSDWSGRNFTKMKIEDASSNIMFIGYLIDKEFTKSEMILTLRGFGAIMEWTPFRANYILAEGLVKAVPSTVGTGTASGTVTPNGDDTQDWTIQGGEATAWETLTDDGDSTYMECSQGEESNTIILDMTTIADVHEVTAIEIDFRAWSHDNDGDMTDCKFYYNLGGWSAAETYTTPTGSGSWVDASVSWTGLSNSNAMAGFQIKIEAPDTFGDAADWFGIAEVSVTITYTTKTLAIDLEDEDEADFTWTADQWINERDVGILIVDNTNDNTPKTYSCSAVSASGDTSESGNCASLTTANDGNYFIANDAINGASIDAVINPTMDGDNIADTNSLEKITIKYKIGVYAGYHGGSYTTTRAKLQISNDGTWETIATATVVYPGLFGKTAWVDGTFELTSNLANYLDKTGANYDAFKGIRVALSSTASATGRAAAAYLDYLSIDIEYFQATISPLQVQIEDNGASWISNNDTVWTDTGVAAGDKFQIGENTTKIINELASTAGLAFDIASTTTKYAARYFRGTYCIEVLKSMCLLEGMIWYEDHENEVIVVAKEADLTDSGVDLTQSDYDHDWKYSDHCNHFWKVEVYGNASYAIYAYAEDASVDSKMIKQIIDDTIMTNADAQEVADAQLTMWDSKRPSIYLTLHGINANLAAGKLVDITMARPTIAKTAYIIRRLERYRKGEHIKTRIYAGLGSTPPDEKIGDLITKIGFDGHRTKTERLVGTPWSGGASITWDDIGGKPDTCTEAEAHAYVEANALALTANLTTTGTIDGVDVATQDTLHDGSLLIGSANATYVPCTYVCCGPAASTPLDGGNVGWKNLDGTDFNLTVLIPYPTNREGLKLYCSGIGVSVYDSDASDYIDRMRLYGVDYNSITLLQDIDFNTVHGTGNGEFTDTFTAEDLSGYKVVHIIFNCVATTGNELDIMGVTARIYYDT